MEADGSVHLEHRLLPGLDHLPDLLPPSLRQAGCAEGGGWSLLPAVRERPVFHQQRLLELQEHFRCVRKCPHSVNLSRAPRSRVHRRRHAIPLHRGHCLLLQLAVSESFS